MTIALILALALLGTTAFLAWLAVKYESIGVGFLAAVTLLCFIGCGNIALTWSQP
ncbi:hypothetical protein [Curtobacterium sp. UCD-KPL2560]|uniref:hypothetical protein n=1 Tax=Curtobacterium sp. UCD-KPL2560 TaxID=1885315 RepID=UPI001495F302|nr:hypothetical protein [Curtobacterium sp. UCD-KPL2560]